MAARRKQSRKTLCVETNGALCNFYLSYLHANGINTQITKLSFNLCLEQKKCIFIALNHAQLPQAIIEMTTVLGKSHISNVFLYQRMFFSLLGNASYLEKYCLLVQKESVFCQI